MAVELVNLPSLEGTKEAYELGSGLRNFVNKMREALKDGWQLDKDLPVALAAAMSDLIPAIQGVEKLPEEARQKTYEFVNGLYVPISLLGKDILGSPAEGEDV